MLFHSRFWPGMTDGSITLAFRRWKKQSVLPGRAYRTPVGLIDVQAVDVVDESDVTQEAAVQAGYRSVEELLSGLAPPDEGLRLYRVSFRKAAGDDPRAMLADSAQLSPTEVAEIDRRLDRLDQASSFGAWTRPTLRAIREHPAVRAGDLAASFGRETQPFKLDVRKLKNLGLTLSLEVGYRLSPRGEAYSRAASPR